MHDVFIGRQPIYDRALDVVAYELLFRAGAENRADVTDGSQATSQVLLNALLEIGLENLVGERLAFVNFTRSFIINDEMLPLDKERIVVEILEDIEPDAEFVTALKRVVDNGYRIALDDFVLNDKTGVLVKAAEFAKLDVRSLNRKQLKEHTVALRKAGVKQLLAEKVETLDEFDHCKELGFDLFQGYFLCRPKVVSRKAVPASRTVALQLLSKLRDPDAGFEELETIVSRDPTLSYKLMHYINSSAFGVRKKVESIRRAIALIGLEPLRMMATLITLAGFRDKPRAIVSTALMRAKMCELLSRALGRGDCDSFYTVGLFSALDVLMDTTMDEALKTLPLCDDVKEALLNHEGARGEVLQCVLAVEQANWDEIRCLTLTLEQIQRAHLHALAYVDETEKTLSQLRAVPDEPQPSAAAPAGKRPEAPRPVAASRSR